MNKSRKKKEEYDLIYNSINNDIFEDFSESDDIEENLKKLKGNISRGDCLYCNSKNTMEYEGHICFICRECGSAVHEDIYYRWAAGYAIEFEE